MSHTSKFMIVAIAILLAPVGAMAQGAGSAAAAGSSAGGSAPGTNSAGTAQSGGTTGTGRSGMGPGAAITNGAPVTGNAAVDAQDRAVDRKVKSICKGC